MGKIDNVHIDDFREDWVQLTISGAGVSELTEQRISQALTENDRLRTVITEAMRELQLICTEEDRQKGEHRKYYQGVDAARDTLDTYFRRHLSGMEIVYDRPASDLTEENKRLRNAVEWYGEQAEAMARYALAIKPAAMEAIVTSMSLDAGRRARAAINPEGK